MTLQFGSSGIRGRYGDGINPGTAFELGNILPDLLGPKLIVGRDPRRSGPVLKAAFLSSALQAGAELVDYGVLPTPALAYQTTASQADGGIMITASHNPAEYNGFKIFNSKGESLEDSSALTRNHGNAKKVQRQRIGRVENAEPHEYSQRLRSVPLKRQWRVILDTGNGATCRLAPEIYSSIAGKVTAINSHPDGTFSGRGSEPTRDSLTTLSSVVKESKADIGVGFDGDGDRFVLVDENGTCPLQDRVLGSYLAFLARESKGPLLIPIDASMAVDEAVAPYGVKLIRGPVGDAKLLTQMKKQGATFAGEPSGAWIHSDFHPCPDGILSGLLYLRKLEQFDLTVSKAVEAVPEYKMVRKSVHLTRNAPNVEMKSLSESLESIVGKGSSTSSRFGLRVSSEDSWVLVRESGTEPVLRITAESKKPAMAIRIAKQTISLINRLFKGRI